MRRTHTIVIGAGQAGLAVSRCLTEAGRDHVVLERGRLAERWRSERWDTLHLLTPNWMTRLPHWTYQGGDPDGFMAVSELVHFFEDYAHSFAAPVQEQTTVASVTSAVDGFRVVTDQGTWLTENVVVATGHCGHPIVPGPARRLCRTVHQVTSDRYRNPTSLPDGGVLVVGASATGVQLAEELAACGRDVVLATGSHARMPRRYRGLDIFSWLDRIGTLDQRIEDHPNPDAARRSPSTQLVGSADGRRLDLGTCQDAGVQVVGRLEDIDGTHVGFGDDLPESLAASEARMHRTLDAIDHHISASGLARDVGPADRPDPLRLAPAPCHLDLRTRGIKTVLWATGFGRSYPWLQLPVLDRGGEIRHHHGVTPVAGLYVVGLRFQHRRNSHFIDGVGRDARAVVDHLTARAVPTKEMAA